MNPRHRKILVAVFSRPTRSGIRWADIESLVRALGGVVEQRRGSRVWMELNGVGAVFHRPHPQPETKKGAVEALRKLLINAGVEP